MRLILFRIVRRIRPENFQKAKANKGEETGHRAGLLSFWAHG